MLMNGTQQLTMGGQTARRNAQAHPEMSLIARLVVWFKQVFCGLIHGHNAVLQFEGERMLLRCTSCGHDTPGWDTRGQRPRVSVAGDPRRHARHAQPSYAPIRKAS
jgi:hypothetical protein